MNLPTNQQVSLRDALQIVPYFDGSSKVPLTILIEACKEAKEIVPNAEANLVKLLRRKLAGEARRCIIGNYYNNLEDFISKLKTILATTVLQRNIPTTADQPIFSKQYRFPPVHKEEISRQINELIDNRIIKPSHIVLR